MGKAGSPTKITSVLMFSCKHTRVFKSPVPVMGDHLWCPRCRKMVTVTEAPNEYRIRCRSCTYSKTCGVARVNAEIVAAKHRMSKPGHVVKMFNGHDLVRTFEDRYQDVIPTMQESNPNPLF